MSGEDEKKAPPAASPAPQNAAGGLPLPEVPPEIEAMILSQMAQGLADEIRAFAPSVDPTHALRAAENAIRIHKAGGLEAVLQDAMPGSDAAEKAPIWGFRLRRANASKTGVPLAQIQVRKDLASVARENPNELVGWLMVYGLVTNPKALAILRTLGYEPEFFQGAAKSKLVI